MAAGLARVQLLPLEQDCKPSCVNEIFGPVSDKLSKTQIDNLGDRLRSGPATDVDLVLLDDFRLSFGRAYEYVVERLRDLKMAPTGRPDKSTRSVIAKLNRETTRLSQMQDIAGCRVVVDSMAEQARVIDALQAIFPNNTFFDRRTKASHSYRAVHLVAYISGVPIEVQVRTLLQHSWAELSEKLSDVMDPLVKYGGGPAQVRTALDRLSEHVRTEENEEESLRVQREADSDGVLRESLQQKEERLRARKLQLHGLCQELIMTLETTRSKL
jgi:putative GTP pyrophosphokinase